MKYTQRIQVLFTEQQYKSLEEIASRDHKKLGALIRDAVEEVYLKEEKKRRTKDAVESLLKLAEDSPTPSPEDWDAWEKEYARFKAGHGK